MRYLVLDINKEMSLNPIVYGRAGEGGLPTVVARIQDDSVNYNLANKTIRFEGTLAGRQAFIRDEVLEIFTDESLVRYHFPNRAFSVVGQYEAAFFSIEDHDKNIVTTCDFTIIVLPPADLTAKEAEDIIDEYNRLVEELKNLQKKNIAELRRAIDELRPDIDALVGKMNRFTKQVDDKYDEITKAIQKAIEKLDNHDFYSKNESDARYAKSSDLTKDKVGLENVDNYATTNQTDSEQGLAGNKFMTPIGVKQHVDVRIATQNEVNEGKSTDKMINPKTLKAALDALKSSYLLSKQEFVINSSNSNYIESGQIVFQRYWDEVFVTGVFKTKTQIPAATSYITKGALPDWLKTDTYNRNFLSKYDTTIVNIFLNQQANVIQTEGAVIPAGKWVAVTSSSYPVKE